MIIIQKNNARKIPIERSWIKILQNNSKCLYLNEKKMLMRYCSVCYRSSPEVFCKKGVLTNFTKFTGENLCQSLLFNKVAALRSATLLKKRLWHKCFPLNFARFLWTSNISGGCFCFRRNTKHTKRW